MQMMRANVFHGPNNIPVEEVPRPHAGAGEAVIRITYGGRKIDGRFIHHRSRK